MKKLLVIGVDGATFRLIKPWIDQLPTFKEFMSKGAYGNLKSVHPPATFPALPSLLTGKNSGKHGVYYFENLKPNSYKLQINNALSIKSRKIWHYLDENNIRSAFINLPGTYPTEKINGIMVSGMFTPTVRSKGFVYPYSFKKELPSDYKIEPLPLFSIGKERFAKDAFKIFESRKKLFKKILAKEFDLYFVFFRITDLLQHDYWKYIGTKHNFSNTIFQAYKEIDLFLEGIIKSKKFSNIIVISDHGFRPVERCFNVNNWLLEEGFLKLKEDKSGSLLFNFLKRLNISDKTVFNLMRSLGVEHLIPKVPESLRRRVPREEEPSIESLGIEDWKKTKAFSRTKFGKVYINTRNKRPAGLPEEKYEEIREEIIKRLRGLKDNGKKLKVDIFKAEEIYSGKFLSNAPDIIFTINNRSYQINTYVSHKRIFEDLSPKKKNAEHEIDGIIMAWGEDIKKGLIKDASLIDIFPTILHFFNIEPPADIDGKVIRSLFKKSFTSKKKKGSKEKTRIKRIVEGLV